MNQFLQGFSPHPAIRGAIIQTIIGSQFVGERLKLPPTGPERTAHAISSSHKHGENN